MKPADVKELTLLLGEARAHLREFACVLDHFGHTAKRDKVLNLVEAVENQSDELNRTN
jgi:hypothetical protein